MKLEVFYFVYFYLIKLSLCNIYIPLYGESEGGREMKMDKGGRIERKGRNWNE